ncbi:hypothetical protein PIB30_080852, partial [Stylosanthes scabra]|nr:hypothetical protein [Stylosanthes scabra]
DATVSVRPYHKSGVGPVWMDAEGTEAGQAAEVELHPARGVSVMGNSETFAAIESNGAAVKAENNGATGGGE